MDSIQDNFYKHIAQTTDTPLGITVDKAQGTTIWDNEGKKYLDFISGIAVSNLGHRHPEVIASIEAQLKKHLFVMVYGEFPTKVQSDLAKAIIKLLPDSLDNIYFTSTGTEGIEGALKLAKRYTGRHKIISFKKAYHGSTHGSLSVSGNEYKKYAFRPLLPEIYHIEFNRHEDLNAIDDKTACVIIETIQGDAGVRIPDKAYMKALRAKCSKHGALLILDEIQVGFGRTGKMFAFEHFDIIPDILVLGKALGGGLPLGAFVSSKKIMSSLTNNPKLGHITTFGGNPLSCAASLGFISALIKPGIIEEVESKGLVLMNFFNHKGIVEVRRIGLMFAVEFENPEIVAKIVIKCLEKGLISFWFLSCPNAFRLAPPLNVSQKDLEEGGRIISESIQDILG